MTRSQRHRRCVGRCRGGDPRAGGSGRPSWQGLRDDPILQELIAEFDGHRRSDGTAWDNAVAAIQERGGLLPAIGLGIQEDATLQGHRGPVGPGEGTRSTSAAACSSSIGQGLEEDATPQRHRKMWDNAVAAIRERGGLWQAILTGLQEDPILQALLQAFTDIGEHHLAGGYPGSERGCAPQSHLVVLRRGRG